MRKLLHLALPVALVCAGLTATLLPGLSQAASAPARLEADLTHGEAREAEDRPGDGVEVEIVRRETAGETSGRVLIYHSHTCEAFEPEWEGQYEPTERWRTADETCSVVRLGAELARILRTRYGLSVTHDDTNYELPRLDDAYARSLEALENYLARGETFDLYIDLHRDAYAEGLFEQNTVEDGGANAARLMVLVGSGEGSWNGRGFAQKPDWRANLALAQRLTDNLNAQAEGLCRPPRVKTGRYNQHVSTGALLVEVGNNRNTLTEALAAIPYLARAVAEMIP